MSSLTTRRWWRRETEYGLTYCSSIWRDNIVATQFHPEKSQAIGLKMLENFGKM